MRKYLLVLLLAIFVVPQFLHAQSKTQKYWVTGLEIPFQWASIDNEGDESGSIVRFAPIINIQSLFNLDPSKAVGFMTGVGVRNVGFIYDVPQQGVRKKYRTYNLAVPIGIKLGDMTRTFFYTGYEIEFPFSYKEKTFVNEVKKDKFVVWFSGRVPVFYNSVFVGINLNKVFNLKLKYYFTNFHNQDYTEIINGEENQPYKNFNANVFFISLNIGLFEDVKFYYDESDFKR